MLNCSVHELHLQHCNMHTIVYLLSVLECATQVSAISLLALSGLQPDYLPEQWAKHTASYRSASPVWRHSHHPRGLGGGISPHPLEQLKRVSLVPPVRPPEGTRPGRSATTASRDSPCSIESNEGTALHAPGQHERVFPYPVVKFPDGASVSSVSSHLPYSLQSSHTGTALEAPKTPGLPSYMREQLPSGITPDQTVTPVSTNPLNHPESDEGKKGRS